jgi:hypothetical protein
VVSGKQICSVVATKLSHHDAKACGVGSIMNPGFAPNDRHDGKKHWLAVPLLRLPTPSTKSFESAASTGSDVASHRTKVLRALLAQTACLVLILDPAFIL